MFYTAKLASGSNEINFKNLGWRSAEIKSIVVANTSETTPFSFTIKIRPENSDLEGILFPKTLVQPTDAIILTTSLILQGNDTLIIETDSDNGILTINYVTRLNA